MEYGATRQIKMGCEQVTRKNWTEDQRRCAELECVSPKIADELCDVVRIDTTYKVSRM